MRAKEAAPVTRDACLAFGSSPHSDPSPPPGNEFSDDARDALRIFHPDPWRAIATAPGDGFLGKERIPGVRDACGESRKGAKKAREAFYPIARRCFFGRRTCRAGNLPSERRMDGRPGAGQWFLEQNEGFGIFHDSSVLQITR